MCDAALADARLGEARCADVIAAYRALPAEALDEADTYRTDPEDDRCLVGPLMECVLGEPEDCTWTRDGREVVDRLNLMNEEIARLKSVSDAERERRRQLCRIVDKHLPGGVAVDNIRGEAREAGLWLEPAGD